MAPYPEYPIPAEDQERLRDLRRLELLDTPDDPNLQRLVDLAAEVLEAPIALVSLVDETRQWFLARHGLATRETPREMAFCAHTITAGEVMVVPDALEDDRFSTNPLVVGEPHIRFYAGAPLSSPEGHALGSFCVIDRKPHNFTHAQLELLEQLAQMVQRELFFRREAALCPVMGIFQRDSFFRLAENDLQRARQLNLSLACLRFEIRGFRQINDSWGYQEGDKLLRLLGERLRSRLQSRDLLGRIGDRDISVLLVDRDHNQALQVARRLQLEVQLLLNPLLNEACQPSCCGGLSRLLPADTCFMELFNRADQALVTARQRPDQLIELPS